jgi:hypothetical protein
MLVYLVTISDFPDAVFSTRELAEKHVAAKREALVESPTFPRLYYHIYERTLDWMSE